MAHRPGARHRPPRDRLRAGPGDRVRGGVLSPAALEAYLHEHIPLSAALGVRVVSDGPGGVVLEAPLEPNLNHTSTAFGGSVAAVAILAGWCQVHLRLRAEGRAAHTVIQESLVRFDHPVEGPFRARALPPDEAAWSRLLRMLERRGRGRVRLAVEVTSEGRTVGRCEGAYVALGRR